MRTERLVPDASVLIESLRDIGYSLETALADIIDNSITAGASRIDVLGHDIDGDFTIGVLDNGSGMTRSELLAAMRPGSRSPLEDRCRDDLGRFGLGMKTASFSQGRRFTVLTRKENESSAASWDLDRVALVNDWVIELPEAFNAIPWSERLGERGTLIVWEKLDRVVERKEADQDSTTFARLMDEAAEHLELVFHRFLSGERGTRKIEIALNGRLLEPFDPFNSANPATKIEPLTPESIWIGEHKVELQTFTLPHHSKVSKSEWEKYEGRGGYLKNQGFYVYREKRLIIHGTWFGLAKQTELTRLTRVRIDIPNGLDSEWRIDVKKAHAQLPPVVRKRLRILIERIGATSKRTYTYRGRKAIDDNKLPVWQRVHDRNQTIYQLNLEHPSFRYLYDKVDGQTEGEIRNALKLVAASLPFESLVADIHNGSEKIGSTSLSPEELQEMIQIPASLLIEAGEDGETIGVMFKSAEPFKSNWQVVQPILEKLTKVDLSNV